MLEQLTAVAVAYPYPWIVVKQSPDGGRTFRVALEADQARVRMGGAREPCEADAAAGAGLADHPGTNATGEDPKQLALFGPARHLESGAAGQIHGRGHRRWQVAPRVMRACSGCAHNTMALVRPTFGAVTRGRPSCRRCRR